MRNAQCFEKLFYWDRMQLGQQAKRQFRFPIRQWEADNNVLTTKLAPKRIRRPFLRFRSAQTIDPDKVPLTHNKRPKAHDDANMHGLSRPRQIALPGLHPR